MGRGKGHVKQRGNSLFLEFSYKGERLRPTLPGLSANKKAHLQRAEDILTQIQADIASNNLNLYQYFPNYPKARKFRKGIDISIKERLELWLEYKRRHCEKTTWILYKSVIFHHLIPQFGEIPISELTSEMVKNWIHSLKVSNKTINNTLIPLRAIFQEAYEDNLIDQNPLSRIRNLPRRTPEPKPFTRDEMEKILSVCEGQLHNLFKFAFSTGLRTSELLGLKWSAVNFKAEKAYIRTVITKTGEKDRPKTNSSIRNIDLHKPAIDALLAQKKHTEEFEFVFHNPFTKKPWKSSERIKRFWTRTLKKAGVEYRPPYTTRHTYASLMLSSGVNPMYVSQQMGHSDWGMIRKIYGRYITDVDSTTQDKITHLWATKGHKENLSG